MIWIKRHIRPEVNVVLSSGQVLSKSFILSKQVAAGGAMNHSPDLPPLSLGNVRHTPFEYRRCSAAASVTPARNCPQRDPGRQLQIRSPHFVRSFIFLRARYAEARRKPRRRKQLRNYNKYASGKKRMVMKRIRCHVRTHTQVRSKATVPSFSS